MTACGDSAEPAVRDEPMEPVGCDQWGEAELAAALDRVCADPPRRFALCEDAGELRVFAWGLDFGDWAVLAGTGRTDLHVASFGSAVGALHRFGVNRDLHLCWVDPELDPEPAGCADPIG